MHYLQGGFDKTNSANFMIILSPYLGLGGLLLCKRDADCRSAEVNYSYERQHTVHITFAMLCCLFLPLFHKNFNFWKEDERSWSTVLLKRSACVDTLVQIQHQAILNNSLWNLSTSHGMLHPSGVPTCRHVACAAWLTVCDIAHVTPTLAACIFHKHHCINHYWESHWGEALSSSFGGSFWFT